MCAACFMKVSSGPNADGIQKYTSSLRGRSPPHLFATLGQPFRQSLELAPLGVQHLLRDLGQVALQLALQARAAHQVLEDEELPLASDDAHGPGHRQLSPATGANVALSEREMVGLLTCPPVVPRS
jgi:hypothetical protein